MKTYKVFHFWAGGNEEPSEYIVQCNRIPTRGEAVKACDIDDEGEEITFQEVPCTIIE